MIRAISLSSSFDNPTDKAFSFSHGKSAPLESVCILGDCLEDKLLFQCSYRNSENVPVCILYTLGNLSVG